MFLIGLSSSWLLELWSIEFFALHWSQWSTIASYYRGFSKVRRKINLLGQNWAPTNAVFAFEVGKFSHIVFFKLSVFCGICALNSNFVQFLQPCKLQEPSNPSVKFIQCRKCQTVSYIELITENFWCKNFQTYNVNTARK